MAVIDILRPVSINRTGAATTVPSGTLNAVTSDNSDSTYINFAAANYGDNWNLRVGPHTPDEGYQRHQVRGRIRIRANAGTCTEVIDLGAGEVADVNYDTVAVSASFTEQIGSWYSSPGYGLATAGELDDLNIGGGWMLDGAGGATSIRTSECYVDVDCRIQPQYSPQVRDASGANKNGGTVTDTTQPTLFVGAVDYDGLPAYNWFVSVRTGSADGPEIFGDFGAGVPPTSVNITTSLADGSYWAVWNVRSTIRGSDPFEHEQVFTFAVANEVPPPSPPLVSVTEEFGGYRVSWADPGGQQWDEGYVVAEVWRDDCTGSQRIATVPNGITSSYLDLAIPQLDPQPGGVDCEVSSVPCDITYRVRYWGYVSTSVELPDTIPADLILGWPSTAGTIPSGWSRVTALDGVFPRGANTNLAPTGSGGATSHSHTTPNHGHQIGAHSHAVGGNTGTSNSSTTSARFNGASRPQADQPHSHARPGATGSSAAFFSGATSPGTNAANNMPPALDVIWIQSAGDQANYPSGCVGWSTESISGWNTYGAAGGRFLKGAAAAGNGGGTSGASTHNHTVNAHTHTGGNHDHSIGSTGLSNPSSSQEAGDGSQTPRWLPRHTHPMDVGTASTGNLNSATGGVVTANSLEPPNRRLKVLQNTGGGTQTRIIGLFTGAISALDPLLTWCNGSSGTPDMRTFFARDAGSDSINSVAGTPSHAHTVPNHSHGINSHAHTTNVLASTTASYEAPSFGDLGSSPTTNHDHSSANTGAATPSVTSNGTGPTNSVDHLPPYKEVHFVRLDGTISGGPLPVPELKVSDYATATVPGFTYSDGLDRLATMTSKLAVATDRTHAFPKSVVDSTPLDGGLHTVSSTVPGEDVSLTISAEGLPAIEALEEMLSQDWVYYSPVGGTPGWFRPGGWTVSSPAPNVKVVQVPMVRSAWPTVVDPQEYL